MTNHQYTASPTLARFHRSNSPVRGVMGPVGSGKSVAMCVELYTRIRTANRGPNGKRKSRWLVVRNTYRELMDTTLNTWLDWFPDGVYGNFSRQDMTYYINDEELEAEVLFRAVDTSADTKKLLSLELTGAWINEAREVPKVVLDMIDTRIRRYPSKRDGGANWCGIILDTNPPDDDHWWYTLFETKTIPGYELYRQPSGLSPEAENLLNLPPNYYTRMVDGKDKQFINVYIHGQYGSVSDGMAIYAGEWSDATHYSPTPLPAIPHQPILLGWDFGLTPACVIVQQNTLGQLRVLDELVATDIGIRRFVEDVVAPFLRRKYPGNPLQSVGDPAGSRRAETDERTAFDVLAEMGILTEGADSNNPTARWDAVKWYLSRMVAGEPAFRLSSTCQTLRKGFNGGYRLRRLQVAGGERFTSRADKNAYSHPHDALQYACMRLRIPARSVWSHEIKHTEPEYAGDY